MAGDYSDLDQFPEAWELKRIGDFASVKGGKRLPAGTALVPTRTNHPYLRIVDFKDRGIDKSGLMFVPDDVFPQIARYIISSRDIYVSIVGTIGLVGVVDKSLDGANLTENAAKICNIADDVDRDYLAAFLGSGWGQHQIGALTVGSTQPKLALFRIGDIRVPLPPLAEQKAIAAVLGALDDKIELNRRMNATLEAMAQALFQSWFVDFDPVRSKLDGRPPAALDPATAALFPEDLEDSPLGHIPKGWKAGGIQDCCVQIQNGGTPRRNEPRFWDGGKIPWLASGEVRQSIITATNGFITEEGLAESSAKWVPAFSTVVALYGATAGQVSFISSRLTTNQAVCALIPKKDFAFFNYLTMRGVTSELENKAVGSAQQNISKGIVEETKVVLPPSVLVERFAEVAGPLFERWISNLHQSLNLATLRDTLLPKLLSGELSVESEH